jgi:hypothetical protein
MEHGPIAPQMSLPDMSEILKPIFLDNIDTEVQSRQRLPKSSLLRHSNPPS